MPANIMDGNKFAERGGRAWWGGGRRLDDTDGKATTAVRIAEIDFPVSTVPLYGTYMGNPFDSGHVAIVRPRLLDEAGDGPVVLGTASDSYTPITNYRIAELLDPLTTTWPTETVGALGKGEDFFVTLNAGRTAIAGDEMEQYFFVWNKHDGTGALRIMFTPVRVVCQNTCLLGAQKANVTTSIVHSRNVDAETQFALDLTVRLQAAQRNAMDELAQFATIKVSHEDITRVLYATYPDRPRNDRADSLLDSVAKGELALEPERIAKLYETQYAIERARKRAADLRLEAVRQLQQLNDERPSFAWTGWLLYQAITAMESHRGSGDDAAKGTAIMTGKARGKNVAAAYTAIAELLQPNHA